MDASPEDLYSRLRSNGGGFVDGIRAMRETFNLDLNAAKEIALKMDGLAGSLNEHQAKLAPHLLAELDNLDAGV